jgi:alpha-galactosidase
VVVALRDGSANLEKRISRRASPTAPPFGPAVMTLWSIARSPLIHGGDMTKTDAFTLSLLTNDDVLAVNQRSVDNRQLFDRDGLIAWTARDPSNGDSYLAVFNTRDRLRLDESNARVPASVLTSAPDSAADIDTDLRGGKKLVLVATPVRRGDDAFQAVLRQSPRFVLQSGLEQSLADVQWTHAEGQWDNVSFSKDDTGKTVGLLAQATAIIEYPIPAGAVRFKATTRFPKPGESASEVRILTVIGTGANEDARPGLPVEVSLADLGITAEVTIRDLWPHGEIGTTKDSFSPVFPFHGARLFRLGSKGRTGR